MFLECSAKTGENVEDAFLDTAKKIYQNIQDGSLDLNAAESGVQHKPATPRNPINTDQPPNKEGSKRLSLDVVHYNTAVVKSMIYNSCIFFSCLQPLDIDKDCIHIGTVYLWTELLMIYFNLMLLVCALFVC
ncbi:Ras- protein Rab-2A [Bulinus truncatus]|nr:Ras- protein Rab-2A [Bulinus truncatus]